jgi:hypothetical protein
LRPGEFAPPTSRDVTGARPNAVLAPRSVYETKTRRCRRQWPTLTMLPWPETGDPAYLGEPALRDVPSWA